MAKSLDMEIWKDIDDYKGYQVSSYGRVKSLGSRSRILKQQINKIWPYMYVRFTPHNKTLRVHRLIAKAFIPNPNNYPEVNHKDGNKSNNHIDNLEWVTSKQNSKHKYNSGLSKPTYGNSRLNDDDVWEIRYLKYIGANVKDIASIYNVHVSNVYGICKYKTWARV